MKTESNEGIIRFLQSKFYSKNFLFFRGEKELKILNNWIAYRNPENETVLDKTELIKKIINSCDACDTVTEKKYGLGNGENGVMIILNTPKLVNIVERKILKDDSLKLLQKMIKAINIDFNECYTTNLYKCQTGDSFSGPSRIIENCKYILKNEIDLFTPSIAIVLGDIIPLQRIIKESADISWFNIEHPITLIKNPELKRPAWNTLKLIMEKLNSLSF